MEGSNRRGWLYRIGLIIGLGILYYGTARFGLLFSYGQSHESPVWPPVGLALAALLLFGWRVWPGIWIGAFAASALQFIQTEGTSAFTALWVSAVTSTGDTLEVLTGWWLYQCWVRQFSARGEGKNFIHALDVFGFASLTLLICVPSACLDSWVISEAGFAPWSNQFLVAVISWIGDASGILLLTPFLMAWSLPLNIHWNSARTVRGIAAFGALALSVWVVFGGLLPISSLAYLTTLPMLWIAVSQGPRAVTSALVLFAASAIWFTVHQQGPFVRTTQYESVLLLEMFLWTVALTSTVLASSVAAQNTSQSALMKLTDELEKRVEERGAELEKTNAVLRSALEKEVILRREINHRVKNNLQVIKSLLFLQSSKIDNQLIEEILRETQSRIQSFSLIYDNLSQRGDVQRIAFAEYVQQLAEGIFAAYRISQEKVTLKIKAEETFLDWILRCPAG